MMVRINLLPREIQEKRKAERFLAMAFGGVIIVAVCLCSIHAFNVWRIRTAEEDLNKLKAQVAKMNTAIQALKVYEARVEEVERKKMIVAKALEDRVIWSRMLEEVMVVTPNDVALEKLEGDPEKVTFTGLIEDPSDTPDKGHKQVARWLVRLSELKLQPKTWLTSSEKQEQVQGEEGVVKPKAIAFINTMEFKEETTTPALPNDSGKK
ncbi:MAG: hypothetical protein IBX64_06535 [Actinobacteria bacterium]|nr:hypothetical protein [Actinomycetota bacterium]